jgi:hypothetical protein
LVGQVCDNLLAATQTTRAISRIEECVPDLHLARLAPGGRLDRWYTNGRPTWALSGQVLSASELARRTLVANGRDLGPAWPVDLPALRTALARIRAIVPAACRGSAPTRPHARPVRTSCGTRSIAKPLTRRPHMPLLGLLFGARLRYDTVPGGTTHCMGCPVTSAIRS